MKKNLRPPLKNYARYSGIAVQMLAIIFVGVFGGFKLDHYLGLHFPVFTVCFSLLSVVIAIYFAVRDFIKKK